MLSCNICEFILESTWTHTGGTNGGRNLEWKVRYADEYVEIHGYRAGLPVKHSSPETFAEVTWRDLLSHGMLANNEQAFYVRHVTVRDGVIICEVADNQSPGIIPQIIRDLTRSDFLQTAIVLSNNFNLRVLPRAKCLRTRLRPASTFSMSIPIPIPRRA